LQQTIADRQLAEAELVRERNLLCALMDHSVDSIYFKDTESRFIRCSAKMADLLRVKGMEDLIGRRDSDFFATDHAREAFADEQEIVRTGQPMTAKIEKETWPDGRVTWALTSKMPFRNGAGETIGTFGISKDITAIKSAEEKLEQVHRQLVDASRQAGMAEIATNVLHNVGNVLNSVNVSSALIADKVRASKIVNLGKVADLMQSHTDDLAGFFTSDAKGKQLPGYLSGLAAHLAEEQEDILHEVGSLVSNIVHIKEIVAMQQSYAKASGVMESLKVADLVEDAARMNSGIMSRHNVKVLREFNDVAPILTEKHKVLQILVNLIRNAEYACDDSERDDKQIKLRITNGDGRIKISVIDNGVGIPPENLTRIFNHGFTTKKDGHGFGLHSGALAAKELGGALTVFSEGNGRGATFTLELPVIK
jgi:PAS domain S-box-containing protein